MKSYRTRKGRILRVGGRIITDDLRGVPLPDSPAVREHLRLKRLFLATASPQTPPAKKKPIHES